MTAPANRLEEVLAELGEHQQRTADLRRRLQSRRATTRSRNGVLSVTVDARGGVSKVDFHSTAYTRMTPGELSRTLTETIAEAQAAMAEGVAEVMAPFRGFGEALRTSLIGDTAGAPGTSTSNDGDDRRGTERHG